MCHFIDEIAEPITGEASCVCGLCEPFDDIVRMPVASRKLAPSWVCQVKCHVSSAA